MSNEIIIEKAQETKQNKNQLIFALIGLVVSVAIIVIGILYIVKVLPREVAIHIVYPGLALNCLLNGFSMKCANNKKVAKIDFIASAVIAVVYIIILIVSVF